MPRDEGFVLYVFSGPEPPKRYKGEKEQLLETARRDLNNPKCTGYELWFNGVIEISYVKPKPDAKDRY